MEPTLTLEGLDIPGDVYTLDGFRAWYGNGTLEDKGIRASFVSARVYVEMTPQNNWTHGPLSWAINRELGRLALERNLGRYCVPPTLLTNAEAGISTEPDGFLVLWSSFRSGKVRLAPERPTEYAGSPDMVLEVVSKSTRRKDLVDLARAYARAGVLEYWTADAGRDEVDFKINVLGSGEDYVPQNVSADGFTVSPILGHAFRLERFVDPAGLPDYRLASRPA